MKTRVVIVALATLAWVSGFSSAFEFIVVGDTRPRFESESFRPFETLIGRINAAKPGLVINLGDLIYGYGPASKEKQWNKYEAVARSIQAPYYQVPGNHDTHSKAARRVYGRRFGKFYESFDYGGCHFVLLDNTEQQRWGCIGPVQLNWLQQDLQHTGGGAVFVFMHFPVWEADRITTEYYDLWARTLHPLFKQAGVKAVFGGHYHTYGPTREFDGIRYFITGGGGAELRPEYRKAGGQYHFMKVKVSGDSFDVRVVTGRGELSDPEADVMGGLQFAGRNVSRIGITPKDQDWVRGVSFNVSVQNPYLEPLSGEAVWLLDTSAFAVEPSRAVIQIPPKATRQYPFILKSLQPTTVLGSLPQLEFNVVSGDHRHRFHREVRIIEQMQTPFRNAAPVLDGKLSDWQGVPALVLGQGSNARAELRTSYDARALYLMCSVPAVEDAEAKELGFSDELQIGLAQRSGQTDFGRDVLRLGLNPGVSVPRDTTPGHHPESALAGARVASALTDGRTCYEIAIPMQLLKNIKAGPGSRIILDLSFMVPEPAAAEEATSEPKINTLSYRVRYGSDSLVPVYFVELSLQSTH